MLRIITIAILALPAAAQAQTTNCRWVGQTWTCQSQKPLDYGAQLEAGRSMVPDYQAQQAARKQADRANLPERVGSLVNRGDCAGAEKLAVRAGDFALAQQVKDYCAK